MNRLLCGLLLLLFAGFPSAGYAQQDTADVYVRQDSLREYALLVERISALTASPRPDTVKVSKFKTYLQSLLRGHVDRTFEKKMDMTYIVAPCYTKEGSFGIGGGITALYRTDRTDSIMPPSDLQLTGSASLKGFYVVGIDGNTYFKGNKSYLIYSATFSRKTLDFWGIDYGACAANPVSKYTRQRVKVDADYIYKLPLDFRIGGGIVVNYTGAVNVRTPAYLDGQKNSYFLSGVSATVQYDTRDFPLNPRRGVYVMLKETLYPRFTGNFDKTLAATTFQFNAFHRLWKNAVLGYDVYGQWNSPDTPWTLREELGGGSCRMRGYYAGRYIDCSLVSVQAEIRQPIVSRLGCVAWGGAGTVFSDWKDIRRNRILPNYGVGLRFEAKHNVNLRVDCGFGRHTWGFVVQMKEAF